MARPIRTPVDFAPISEKLRAMSDAPSLLEPPPLPEEPADLQELRALLVAATELLIEYQPAYSADASVETFLAQSAATGAIFRLRAISELISDGICGLVAAGMARSLLDDGATWAWVAEDPGRDDAIGDYLASEWVRLLRTAGRSNTPESALERWLVPSAWSGNLATSSSATAYPGTSSAVGRLSGQPESAPDPGTPLRLPGIATMAALLANCGHFNCYSALLCPFNWDPAANGTEEGALGGRLIPEMEAVVIHLATAATFTICVVTAWSNIGPATEARELLGAVGEVFDAIDELAPRVHGLGSATASPRASVPFAKSRRTSGKAATPVSEAARRWTPPLACNIEQVRAGACTFFDIATREGPLMVPMPPVSRLRFVTIPLIASTMWATRTLAHDTNTTTVGVHAARQLLEEGARWRWTSTGVTPEDRIDRMHALMSQLATSRDRVVATAHDDGVADSIGPFVRPSGFDIDDLLLGINRSAPPPTLTETWDAAALELHGLGGEWVRLAYSLLSQVTHHTPIGALQAIRADGTTLLSGSISPQLEALAIDVGCLGACWLWSTLGLLQLGAPMSSGEEFEPEAYRIWVERLRVTASEIHRSAMPLHGLLNQSDLRHLGRNERCRCGSGHKAKRCHLR
jgi:hypothetical protein